MELKTFKVINFLGLNKNVELKFQDNRIINAKCFEKEKASVLWEKLNLNDSNENIHKITWQKAFQLIILKRVMMQKIILK